ncbi:MAG: hypothetical protein CMF49_07385 [Legionellales bacterium]|nr:hypothetical protein [Legionellales bacterium]|tara:strand:+ start:366 stop:1043 length:678 start_codon:yes stop_codon:yes gene_type:complete
MRLFYFLPLSLLLCKIVFASNLQIQPVNINFKPQQTMSSIKLTNHDNKPIVLQIAIKQWQQDKNGKDIYQSTKALLATPKIFTIKPGHTQIIRLAIIQPQNRSHEQTYRLFIKELPRKQKNNQTNQLQLIMQYILPIFINETKPLTKVSYHLLKKNNKTQSISVVNQSNHHIVLTGILINDSKNDTIGIMEERGIYLLAGAQYQLVVPLKNTKALPTSAKILYLK